MATRKPASQTPAGMPFTASGSGIGEKVITCSPVASIWSVGFWVLSDSLNHFHISPTHPLKLKAPLMLSASVAVSFCVALRRAIPPPPPPLDDAGGLFAPWKNEKVLFALPSLPSVAITLQL